MARLLIILMMLAVFRDGLVDEWVVYMAPCVLGDGGRGLFHLPGLERMADRFQLAFKDVRQCGRDLRITLNKSS